MELSDRKLIGIVALVGAVYVFTFSRMSVYDSLCYYKSIEMGTTRDLIHPHHLVYLPLQKAWHHLWMMLGYSGRTVLPAKTLSLIAACSAVLVFGLTLRLFITSLFESFMLVLVFAFTYLVWHFASEAHPISIFLLMSISSLYLMFRLLFGMPLTWRYVLAVAAVNIIGVLLHQELVLILPLSIIILWYTADPASRSRFIVTYLITVCVGIAIPYLVVGRFIAGAEDGTALFQWAASYFYHYRGAGMGDWGNLGIAPILRGWGRVFFGEDTVKPYLYGLIEKDQRFYLALVPFICTGLLVTAGLVFSGLRLRPILAAFRTQIALMAGMIMIFGFAAAWWEPANRTFWAPVVAPLLIIVGLGYTSVLDSRFVIARRIMLATLLATLFLGNLTAGILIKHSHSDEDDTLLVELKDRVRPVDDMVILRDNRLWRLVDYYAPQIRAFAVVPNIGPLEAAHRESRMRAASAARQTLKAGHRVFISSEVVSSTGDILAFLQLPSDTVLNIYGALSYTDVHGSCQEYRVFEVELPSILNETQAQENQSQSF